MDQLGVGWGFTLFPINQDMVPKYGSCCLVAKRLMDPEL